MPNNKAVFTAYLDAFTSGDLDTARQYITEDFKFRGPMLQVDGKEEFFAGASGLLPIMRGYNMLHQFEDGPDICSIYEFKVETPKGQGSVLMSEWNQVRDGQLASARLVFDTAAFNALMPG